MTLILTFILMKALTVSEAPPVQNPAPVEVVQVLDFPISITDVDLTKAKNGFLLSCRVSNDSEFQLLGITYSLAVVDSTNVTNAVVIRSETVRLTQYQTKRLTFSMPGKFKLKADQRLVFLLQRVTTAEYLWEVLKAKDALEAYISGDYSVVPRVVRVRNQVDVPPRARVIY